jgi:hypothetical protein
LQGVSGARSGGGRGIYAHVDGDFPVSLQTSGIDRDQWDTQSVVTDTKNYKTAREGTQKPKSRELRTAASPQTVREGYPRNQKSREFRTAASPKDCKEGSGEDSIESHIITPSPSSLHHHTSPIVGLSPGETASPAISASQG